MPASGTQGACLGQLLPPAGAARHRAPAATDTKPGRRAVLTMASIERFAGTRVSSVAAVAHPRRIRGRRARAGTCSVPRGRFARSRSERQARGSARTFCASSLGWRLGTFPQAKTTTPSRSACSAHPLESSGDGHQPSPLHAEIVRDYRTILWTLFASGVFRRLRQPVNLLLVRGGLPTRVAVRPAGASRWRLTRMLLAEAAVPRCAVQAPASPRRVRRRRAWGRRFRG